MEASVSIWNKIAYAEGSFTRENRIHSGQHQQLLKKKWHKEPPGYLLLYGLETSAHIKLQNAWDSESEMTSHNEKHHAQK